MNSVIISENTKLREILDQEPLCAGVLYGLKPDFWDFVDSSFAHAGIDYKEFVNRNEAMKELHEEPDWNLFSIGQMIFYLQNTHHFYAKTKMPQLDRLLELLDNIPNYRRITREYRHFKSRTLKHILLEDEIIFPWLLKMEALLREFSPEKARELLRENTVDVLCHDHKEDDDEMRQLRALTNFYKIEKHYPLELKVLYAELEKMEDDLKRHAHIEDQILFWKAEELENLLRKRLQ